MLLSKKSRSVNDSVIKTTLMPSSLIKTMILTPNRFLLLGLEICLHSNDLIEVIKTDTCAEHSLVYWQQQDKVQWPHLLLISTWMKHMSCIEAIQRFKFLNPKLKIIVMGDYDTNATQWFYTGAHGYINQSMSASELNQAIVTVCGDGEYFLEKHRH